MREPQFHDFDRIHERLLMGSKPSPHVDYGNLGIDIIVICAAEHDFVPSDFKNVGVLAAGMADSEGPNAIMSIAIAQEAGHKVAEFCKKGRTVLVTCHEGRNRSGLVCALALREMTGWSAKHCIDLIRSRRRPRSGLPALANKAFVSWLKALDSGIGG